MPDKWHGICIVLSITFEGRAEKETDQASCIKLLAFFAEVLLYLRPETFLYDMTGPNKRFSISDDVDETEKNK